MVRICLPLVLVLSMASVARAESLTLPEGKVWAVLASRQDQDEAIAIVRARHATNALVVKATNGWFAALEGPYAVKGETDRRFLQGLVEKGAPKDSYLARGTSFTDVVWRPPPTHVVATLEYDGVREASMSKDGIEIKLSRQKDKDGDFDPVLTATYKGKSVSIRIADNAAEKPAASATIVRLDPASPIPQIAFTYFTQGAHCCTATRFATLDRNDIWHVVDGQNLDGDGGYLFEDLEGKGYADLITIDNAFLYAFDSYAGSNAPTTIHRLEGDKLVNVTRDPQFQHTLIQDLDTQEAEAGSPDRDSWHSNGFLAGWVASSILVGRGPSAWTKMLSNWDRTSDFGPERCLTGAPVDSCPKGKTDRIPFPVALRGFLVKRGYVSDATAYPVTEPGAPPRR